MKRRNQQDRFDHDAIAVCHNHLNGSAHCLECGGECAIRDPTQAALTCIVRALIDSCEFNDQPVPYPVAAILKRHGVDIDAMRKAARSRLETSSRAKPGG